MEAINTSSTFFQLFCKSLQEKIYVLCAYNLTHIVSLYINKIYHKNHWTIRRAQKRPRKILKYNSAFMPHSLNFRAALLNEKVMIPWMTPGRHDTFKTKRYWIYIVLILSSYYIIRYRLSKVESKLWLVVVMPKFWVLRHNISQTMHAC